MVVAPGHAHLHAIKSCTVIDFWLRDSLYRDTAPVPQYCRAVRCNLRQQSTNYLIMKQLISILFILIPMNIYCQVDTINKNLTGKTIDITLTEYEQKSGRPTVMLIFEDSQINLDSITIKKIDPNWIRKIKVLKEKHFKSIHADVNGTILIYPKSKYHDQIKAV